MGWGETNKMWYMDLAATEPGLKKFQPLDAQRHNDLVVCRLDFGLSAWR